MTKRFFEIAQVGRGTLYIGPRAQSETLDDWCDDLVRLGVSHVVSFIGDSEVLDYGLEAEEERLRARAIGFTHFPIVDFGAPRKPGYRNLVADMYERLSDENSVFAHCAGGVGRAGTFAACLLVASGMDADAAMQLVTQKRGVSSPETAPQADFVRRFSL